LLCLTTLDPMLSHSSVVPNHLRAVGQDGLANITIFNNLAIIHDWHFLELIDGCGRPLWRAVLISPSVIGSERIEYIGFGSRKSQAKDRAAHDYLVFNQVIMPPALSY